MKKIILYIIVLITALLVPERGMDVGKLLPVELVSVYAEGNQIVIETDTEDIGRGATIHEAFQNLEDTTAGVIYLDTADYLLISDEAGQQLEELEQYLKQTVDVCICNEKIDLTEAAKFLAVHKPNTPLKQVAQEGGIKQELKMREGRLYLLKKVEKRA